MSAPAPEPSRAEGAVHQGFLLQPTYQIRRDAPVVQLYGRLSNGEAFLVEDDRFRPYFFAPRNAADFLDAVPNAQTESSDLVDFAGQPVLRVAVATPGSIPPLREKLHAAGFPALEADLRFPYRYLIDHDLRTAVAIEGESELLRPGLRRFLNPTLGPGSGSPELSLLSVDIETTLDASRVLSVALAGCGSEEVHMVGRQPVAGAVVHAHEALLFAALVERFAALDPDVIVGWNVVDFDLRVLDRRGRALHVPFQIGRVPGPVQFRQDPGFTRQSRAEVPGRVVLDGIPLVRDALRLEDYRLETVAQAVVGRGKRIDHDVPDAGAEIQRLYREDPAALAAYNLEDARLVLEILAREELVDLGIERSLLSGMPLDRVGASVASFDMLYLPELRRRGVVAPSVDASRKSAMVRGGALLEPQAGLYRGVAVFDFKSLYPSLIRTFHLDPLAHAHARSDGDDIEAPNGARFSRETAILPGLLERFVERRESAKRRGAHHADQAIKIMMNALFGVLGSSGCRFFDAEVANAITGFGQQTLGWTRDAFEAEGLRVLYGDTDSVFVQLPEAAPTSRVDALRERIERRIHERVRHEYGVTPQLTLELERIFRRFFLPRVRSRKSGSKKRYAGWIEDESGTGKLVVIGLESVRRDWPRIAKRLQEGMLERLFLDEAVLPFVRDTVEAMRRGDHDDELVYVKRIRKGALEKYTAARPPHIQAALKARERARRQSPEDEPRVGRVIRYVITATGPEPVIPGEPLPGAIDRRHYLEHVLRPIADAILIEQGEDMDEALGAPKQLGLF